MINAVTPNTKFFYAEAEDGDFAVKGLKDIFKSQSLPRFEGELWQSKTEENEMYSFFYREVFEGDLGQCVRKYSQIRPNNTGLVLFLGSPKTDKNIDVGQQLGNMRRAFTNLELGLETEYNALARQAAT